MRHICAQEVLRQGRGEGAERGGAGCSLRWMPHCIALLSPQMLAGLGLTRAEGEAALAYFVHPAVADPLVTRASIAVKM